MSYSDNLHIIVLLVLKIHALFLYVAAEWDTAYLQYGYKQDM